MTVQETSVVESMPNALFAFTGELQRLLAPPISFESSRLEVYGQTTPHDTFGGDLADLVASGLDVIAYVADVSGHGPSAGMLMGMVKTAARYGLMFGQPLPELLEGINRVLPSVKEPNMYATFAAVRLNTANEVEYTVAGNMPVLHYRKSRREVVRLSMEQFPLGLFPAAGYTSNTAPCGAGDLFAIFTDGLVETADPWGEQFGLNRLAEVLGACSDRPLPEIYDAALDAVGQHGDQTDDRTLMLVRVLARIGCGDAN